MKRQFLFLAVVTVFLTFTSSCKKTYTCTCTYGQGVVDWTGQVEATSKAKAVSTVAGDCTAGDNVTCN